MIIGVGAKEQELAERVFSQIVYNMREDLSDYI
jgi:hypothetical protein